MSDDGVVVPDGRQLGDSSALVRGCLRRHERDQALIVDNGVAVGQQPLTKGLQKPLRTCQRPNDNSGVDRNRLRLALAEKSSPKAATHLRM
eukprot:CAMPEP_0176260990 /NCGR_PEP_ID=MMETSP0121_2-20121125/39866_1 /TAXON_ID=160619 /ORGANISM="Kryptoperidinium foliaceum, Strain CCMP 1326" /LENGTH=90 /DNA_ID=CAMNT_0017600915 /DNA_START=27 /DNA_END=297 /DNA_ORIENTATION=+